MHSTQPSVYMSDIGNQVVSQSHSMQTTIVPTPNHATATANDPCSQIAHVLQCYQQVSDSCSIFSVCKLKCYFANLGR